VKWGLWLLPVMILRYFIYWLRLYALQCSIMFVNVCMQHMSPSCWCNSDVDWMWIHCHRYRIALSVFTASFQLYSLVVVQHPFCSTPAACYCSVLPRLVNLVSDLHLITVCTYDYCGYFSCFIVWCTLQYVGVLFLHFVGNCCQIDYKVLRTLQLIGICC